MEISIKIRKTKEEDKSQILELARKNVDSYERTHLGDETVNEYLKGNTLEEDLMKYFESGAVALENEEIIGFLFTNKNEITGLALDSEHWGKGIAQRLIAFATGEFFNEEEEIQLECFITSPRANRFYRKMGFELAGIADGSGGARAVYKRRLRGVYLTPKDILLNWIDTFNRGDAKALADFYRSDATNHQVVTEPIVGKAAIYEKFLQEFNEAEMVCILENIFQDGEWAIMEWKDPKGFRGCGFFNFIGDEISFQRGYMDKLSFLNANNLPTT